jgi:arsenite methyltransferase
VSGALAERVFAEKLERAGFADVWVGGHRPFGIDDAALFPLFTQEIIEVMRRTIPDDHQDRVATAVIIKAAKPRQGSGAPTT